MAACAPISDDSKNPPAKSTVSLSATAVVSSVQLEINSTLALTNIGAIIRLATEAAPTKAEAETNSGYVSLEITAGGTRKFSISQHYGSDFTNGLTLADVLTSNTQYKLYLFFEPNAIPAETIIEGATLNNDVIALSFTTATLPPAGDAVWDNAWTNEQFVGSLPEWGYSENQKGIFVAYTKIKIIPFTSIVFNTTGLTSMEFISVIFSLSFGAVRLLPGFLSNMSKLGGSYPDGDNYYYVISADDTAKILGNLFRLETTDGLAEARLTVPLTRYGSP